MNLFGYRYNIKKIGSLCFTLKQILARALNKFSNRTNDDELIKKSGWAYET